MTSARATRSVNYEKSAVKANRLFDDNPLMNMAVTHVKQSRQPVYVELAATACLLGLFYLHAWHQIRPALISPGRYPIFMTGTAFLADFTARPGGIVAYVSSFFSQFYLYSWTGALVMTLAAGLTYVTTRGLLKTAGGGRPNPAVCFIPVILLALIYDRYLHDPIAIGQIIAALIFANVYARIPVDKPLRRVWVLLAISVAVYYLAGSGYVLFAVLCGIIEFAKRRSIILGILWLGLAAAVPWAMARYSYEISLVEAYSPVLPLDKMFEPSLVPRPRLPEVLQLVFVLFFPLAMIWSSMGRVRASAGEAIRKGISEDPSSSGARAFRQGPAAASSGRGRLDLAISGPACRRRCVVGEPRPGSPS